jgi:hypothetical protein
MIGFDLCSSWRSESIALVHLDFRWRNLSLGVWPRQFDLTVEDTTKVWIRLCLAVEFLIT